MSGSTEKKAKSEALRCRQARVIAALLVAPSIEDAARVSKVSAPTVRRWMVDDRDFQERLQSAQARLLEEVFSSLAVQASQAVASLVRNLSCGVHGVEVRASLGFLGLLLKRESNARYARLEAEISYLHEILDSREAEQPA